jgi:hypothetical protein
MRLLLAAMKSSVHAATAHMKHPLCRYVDGCAIQYALRTTDPSWPFSAGLRMASGLACGTACLATY